MPAISRSVRHDLAAIPLGAPENTYYGLIRFYMNISQVQITWYALSQGQIVFFLEAKPLYRLTTQSARAEADDQMRRRFQQLLPHCPLSALYAISVFGSVSCIYRYTPFSNDIEPPLIPSHPLFVTDIAPVGRWAYDMRVKRESKIIMAVLKLVDELCW